MKLLAAMLASLSLFALSPAQAEETKAVPGSKPMSMLDDLRMVAPALETYTRERLLGEVWKRPGLMAVLDCREESVSVPIEEVTPQDWAEKAYRPEILGHPQKVYKKPGYVM